MTQIKSENAKRILQENRSAECMPYGMCTANGHFDLEHDYVSLDYVFEAVIIAEKEAEECHAKELQELRDKAAGEFCNNCMFSSPLLGNLCPDRYCPVVRDFTQKLTKK